MYVDQSKIEEIKNRVDIVDLVSEYVTLKKAGRNFTGLCPFHQEKTPSFSVNREKQIFYCFGCGEGGNAITFLMKIADKTFPEAIKDLAAKTGIVLPPVSSGKEGRQKDLLKEGIVGLNARAAQHFSRNLFSAAGAVARKYLQERGIADDIVKQFRLGYAPDTWRSLTDDLEKSGLSLKLAEQAGLIIPGKEGGFYDRFRGRLIFPIENVSGDIIAFGGRILGKGEPKYLNSPESPVYIKGRNLYGLNKAKEEIRKKGFVLIVEGYFDLISLWNAGIGNVVATLGTALTREHLELLRRYTIDVVALFDPDEAGKKALDRSLELFLSAGMKARALILPGQYDPDDYVRKFGKEKMEELITLAQPLSDYYIENVLGAGKTFEDKRDMVRNAMEFIAKISDKKEKDLFIKRIAEKTGVNEELLIKEIYRSEGKSGTKAEIRKQAIHVDYDPVELALIQLMMEYPQKIMQVDREKILDFFMQPEIQHLGKKIIDTYKLLGFIDLSVILSDAAHSSLREKIYKLMMKNIPVDETMMEKIFADNIRQIKRKWYKEQHRQIKIKLNKAQENGNQDLINKLIYEKENLLMQEKELH
ncbi:MAG TPA: DNA primase [Smithella sp.]|nr:DNA primase [Smithella sp.]MDM7988800.1 DNA primase [Smithella sp.]HNY51413.1 DNA primase [Smithella sp.]HOG91225.1 DNA primase [Smithella sp.]HOU51028.1 DNA primase [Smithella sp.]